MESMDCSGNRKEQKALVGNSKKTSGNPEGKTKILSEMQENEKGEGFFGGEIAELDQLYAEVRKEVLRIKKGEASANTSALRQNLSNISQSLKGTLNLISILKL